MARRFVIFVMLVAIAGCENDASPQPAGNRAPPPDQTAASIVFLSITGDGSRDVQPLDMAMKLAGFSLDEGREVVLFFNVKGVHVPTTSFPPEMAFQDVPVKDQLADLIQRGAEVHVCPICMKALGVEASQLVEGAQVTTRPKLFAKIGGTTTVFTY